MPDIIFHNLTDKIHRDQCGWSANPFMLPGFPREFGHLHMVSISPGAVRGNHLHRTAREWFFVFGGEYLVRWKSGNEVKERRFSADEMMVMEIPPGAVHAVRNESNSTIYLLAFQDADREKIQSDTVADIILDGV